MGNFSLLQLALKFRSCQRYESTNCFLQYELHIDIEAQASSQVNSTMIMISFQPSLHEIRTTIENDNAIQTRVKFSDTNQRLPTLNNSRNSNERN